MCDVVGCEVGSHEITPLVQELWSQNAPGFISENEQILSLIERVRRATNHRGVLVYDRGGDRRDFLIPLDKRYQLPLYYTATWRSKSFIQRQISKWVWT